MPSTSHPILVTGATGRQGRAAVAALLERGFPVRALVRDATGAPAHELAAAGARLAVGDLDDAGSIERALDGAHGLFLYQPLFMSADLTPGLGPDSELTRGRAVIGAAAAANVEHVVYSSALGADRPKVSPLLAPKQVLEAELAATRLATTILRPVGFMENYAGPWRGLGADGTIATPAPPHIRKQLVAIRDIGAFAALAFSEPDRYIGAALELAGDEPTVPQIAAALSRALDRSIRYSEISIDQIRRTDAARAAALDRIYGQQPDPIDIGELRRRLPSLLTLGAWLESGGAGLVAAYLQSPIPS
ncbi:MAG TPA: NmrA/HSCARG family protein [Candidatus Dormibacteraeota bacterium]|jgi:uncharacterized protein YbjT (DUF2867 family)|nr:NmrA/HSCARG family protein [Candidatus Dormibacteraeota bacterium]